MSELALFRPIPSISMMQGIIAVYIEYLTFFNLIGIIIVEGGLWTKLSLVPRPIFTFSVWNTSVLYLLSYQKVCY